MNTPLTKDGVEFKLGMSLWQRHIFEDEDGSRKELDPVKIRSRTNKNEIIYRYTGDRGWYLADKIVDGYPVHFAGRICDLYSNLEAAQADRLKEAECTLDALRVVLGIKAVTPRKALADLLLASQDVWPQLEPEQLEEMSPKLVTFRLALKQAEEALT